MPTGQRKSCTPARPEQRVGHRGLQIYWGGPGRHQAHLQAGLGEVPAALRAVVSAH